MNEATGSINKPAISIVIPALNEEGNLEYLYDELSRYLKIVDMNWELIIVDDGSTDKTWHDILILNKKDSRVKGLKFSRNFGHQSALFAGLNCARGSAVVTMDADMQHPPEIIPKLIEEWKKGFKIVNTIRIDNEKTKFSKRITSKYFYRFFTKLSGMEIKSGTADFRLIDEKVVKELLKFSESSLFFRGIIEWLGFDSTYVEFKCRDRLYGTTKYGFRKMFNFATTGITSFSLKPLYLGFKIGILSILIAMSGTIWELYKYIFIRVKPHLWAPLFIIIFILFGLLFITVGITGEYIGRILIETRKRPRYIISERLGVNEQFKVKSPKYG